jgi:aspartyl/asparaginyl-tRNA synthetase
VHYKVNDGSCLKGLQVVAGAELPSYSEVDRITTGASVAVTGTIQESPGQGQRFELKATQVIFAIFNYTECTIMHAFYRRCVYVRMFVRL